MSLDISYLFCIQTVLPASALAATAAAPKVACARLAMEIATTAPNVTARATAAATTTAVGQGLTGMTTAALLGRGTS